MQFISAAPVALALEEALNPHRMIFDMGRSKIWMPSQEIIPVKPLSLGELGPYMDRSIALVLARYGENIGGNRCPW
jgi:hypothetical protein